MSPPPPQTPLPVFSLLCHADVERAMVCFGSLYQHCKEPFRHVVIDDGSLTPADRDLLLGRFGGMTILSRAEQDERTLPLLKNHPNCRKFRTEQYFALKLIDPPLQFGGAFALCDGDILFVRDFTGIDRRSEPGQDLVAMRDWTSAYSIPFRRRAIGRPRIPLPQNVNAGILYVGPSTFDLDYVEWLIGQDEFRRDFFILEQTTWAALGGRKRPFHFEPTQVCFPKIEAEFPSGVVALHFIRCLRDQLDRPEYREKAFEAGRAGAEADAGRVARLEAVPAPIDGLFRGSLTRVRRLFRADRPPWYEPAPRAAR